MNTRNLLLLLISLLLYSGKTFSQAYYYYTTKTLNEDGYSYQCDVHSWKLVTLYNKNNIYTYAQRKYKDGTPFTDRELFEKNIKLIEDDNWTKQKCFSIINAAFSASEKQRIKERKFDISMTIDTSTGKVIEVDFCFFYTNPFATIPVSTYRKIELDLKNQIWFTLTDTGKSLNFTKLGWMHEVE